MIASDFQVHLNHLHIHQGSVFANHQLGPVDLFNPGEELRWLSPRSVVVLGFLHTATFMFKLEKRVVPVFHLLSSVCLSSPIGCPVTLSGETFGASRLGTSCLGVHCKGLKRTADTCGATKPAVENPQFGVGNEAHSSRIGTAEGAAKHNKGKTQQMGGARSAGRMCHHVPLVRKDTRVCVEIGRPSTNGFWMFLVYIFSLVQGTNGEGFPINMLIIYKTHMFSDASSAELVPALR